MFLSKKKLEELVQQEVVKMAQSLTESIKKFQADFLIKTDSIQDVLSKKLASDISGLSEQIKTANVKVFQEAERLDKNISEIEALMKELRASSVDSTNKLAEAIEGMSRKKKSK